MASALLRRSALAAGAAVVALALASCSISSTASSSTHPPISTAKHAPTAKSPVLCNLVGASVVATVLNTNMHLPTSQSRGSSTECLYRSKTNSSVGVLLRFDAQHSRAMFNSDRAHFEKQGQKLGPLTGLGDEAYYFYDTAAGSQVTTVVLRQQDLQILVTGTGTLPQIGSVARVAVTQYDSMTQPTTSTTGPR